MIAARLLIWLFVLSYFCSTTVGQENTSDPHWVPRSGKTRVRFDAVHSHTWVESVPRPGINQYHLLASPSRAAQALVAMGWEIDVQLQSWDSDSLDSIDLVVFNLVSADRPALKVSEITALRDFVERGGGLILITDHTNCYFHNHVLEPLFEQFDLHLSSQTACEKPPRTLSTGSGWIVVDTFKDHPIVHDLQKLGIQTGGTVDSRFGVAWTSSESWGDQARIPMYGEGKDMGFSGNFTPDPGEPSGPLAVVAAKQFGHGRIVVIGDQNAIGGVFLNYADNRRFWLQCSLWAAGQTEQTNEQISKGLAAEPERTLVWCVEPFADHDYYWGSTDRERYYHAFAMLNKQADARATDRDLMDAQWMMIPNEDLLHQEHWIDKSIEFLNQPEKHVVIFVTEGEQIQSELWSRLLSVREHQLTQSDSSRTYTFENRSTLEWWKQTKRWTNRQLLGPESVRNDSDYRWEEALLDPMWKLGLKRVKSFEELVNWPEE